MEINNIGKLSIDNSPSREIREAAAPPPPPRDDPIRERSELNRPVAPQRPPALIKAVTQSLNQAGLETATVTSVQGTDAAIAAQTQNDLEASQNEKAAQALQAFMHSLVQAANSRNDDTGAHPASIAKPTPASQNLENQLAPHNPADAYGGLVSRLESLASILEGVNGASNINNGLDQLNAAFESLATASTGSNAGREGEAPKLQTVLQNMIRNLQSTGDPTLASTGNVINTAA